MKNVKTLKLGTPMPEQAPNYEQEFGFANNGFVVLPEHEYAPKNLDRRLVGVFGSLTLDLASGFRNRREYPNARLHVYPSTLNISKNHINFMLAWGRKTDLPHPRQYKVSEYFTRLQITTAKMRKRALVHDTLDAQGVLGKLHLSDDESVVSIYSNHRTPGCVTANTYVYDPLDFRSAVDIISDIPTLDPLRFHAGIRYIPMNRYIGIESADDDQRHILSRLSS